MSKKSGVNVVWHKCTDLRLHDNECVSLAHADGLEVLHVFCFDPFWWRRLPLTGYTKTGARDLFPSCPGSALPSELPCRSHSDAVPARVPRGSSYGACEAWAAAALPARPIGALLPAGVRQLQRLHMLRILRGVLRGAASRTKRGACAGIRGRASTTHLGLHVVPHRRLVAHQEPVARKSVSLIHRVSPMGAGRE